MNGYGGAQDALRAQFESEHASDPAIKQRLISEVRALLPQAKTGLREHGYPRHIAAPYRADQVWYGNPSRLLFAWTFEAGVGFNDYGYVKVPERSMRIGILIDESDHIRIIGTPDVRQVAYGDFDITGLNQPQLQALKILCTQLSGPPKQRSWEVPPLAGHAD